MANSVATNNILFASDSVLQNAAGANGNGGTMNVGGMAGVLLQVTGTGTWVVTPKVSVDGNFLAVQAISQAGGVAPTTSITSAGLYYVPLAGGDQIQAVVSGYSSGSVTVTAKATTTPSAFVITSLNALPTGSSIIGKVTTDQTTHGTTDLVAADITKCGGTTVAAGSAVSAASIPVVIASDQGNVATKVVQWGGTNVLTGGSNGSVGVGGLAASAAAYAGNPVAIGAEFLSWATLPAATTGQAVSLISDPSGTLKVGTAPLGTPIYGSSNGGASANNVTLTIPANKMGFLDGFDIDGLGATGASAITVTVTGVLGGTLTFNVPVVAGATTANPPFSKRFNPPLQASAINTNLVVNVPSFGAGNTAASVNAYGHYV